MFDINGGEFLVIAILAVVLVGPERLPEYVRVVRALVKRGRVLVQEGQAALGEEFGADVDWQKLDPRQYDPRRIVREALFEEDAAPPVTTTPTGPAISTRRAERATAERAAAARAAAAQAVADAVGSEPGMPRASDTATPVLGVPAIAIAASGAPFDLEAT